MKALKGMKNNKPFHTAPTQKAHVNMDGSGVKNKEGRVVDSYMNMKPKSQNQKSTGRKKQTLA